MPPERIRDVRPPIGFRRHRTIIFCLFLFATASLMLLLAHLARPQAVAISMAQFELLTQPPGFALQFTSDGKTKTLAIPREWLVPPREQKAAEGFYVNPFHYDRVISSFPIGNGQTGLHLSSYEIQQEGSANAASGKDVFLIFDPASFHVSRGGIERGLTKERVRSEGCFGAIAERYFLADVDGDGMTDIGVVKEKLECFPRRDQKRDVDYVDGPFYRKEPVAWYIFKKSAWTFAPRWSGRFPEHYQELPLIGIDKTPVDFVGNLLWKTSDRAKWPEPKKSQRMEAH